MIGRSRRIPATERGPRITTNDRSSSRAYRRQTGKLVAHHPDIQYVARDRSKEYRMEIETALPKAIQIADRWHLLLNLCDRIQRTLPVFSKRRRKMKRRRTPCHPHPNSGRKCIILFAFWLPEGILSERLLEPWILVEEQ